MSKYFYVGYLIGPLKHIEFLPIFTAFEVYQSERDFLLKLKEKLNDIAEDCALHFYDDGTPYPIENIPEEYDNYSKLIKYIDCRINMRAISDEPLSIDIITMGDYDFNLIISTSNCIEFGEKILKTHAYEVFGKDSFEDLSQDERTDLFSEYLVLEYLWSALNGGELFEDKFVKLFIESDYNEREFVYML